MRKNNYLIALINKNQLNVTPPWWITPLLGDSFYLSKTLEWSISYCLLDNIFTDSNELSDYLFHSEILAYRFVIAGIIHLLLLPFISTFLFIHFFLENAQQFQTNKVYLGPRVWSNYALWKFREFNELPHVFEERMKLAYDPAISFINSFDNIYLIILARASSYIIGALIGSLLLISFISDYSLIYVQIGNKNLLWYLGVFTALFAFVRSLIPNEEKSKYTPEILLEQMASHTHYFPNHWNNPENFENVKNEIAHYLQFKSQHFFLEMTSIILTPLILMFSLPESSPKILKFIREHTVYYQDIGAICDFSLMDLNEFGDPSFENSTFSASKDKPLDGKLEKSILSFLSCYPNMTITSTKAQQLVHKISSYRDLNAYKYQTNLLGSVLKSDVLHSSKASHLNQLNYLNSISKHPVTSTKSKYLEGVLEKSTFLSQELQSPKNREEDDEEEEMDSNHSDTLKLLNSNQNLGLEGFIQNNSIIESSYSPSLLYEPRQYQQISNYHNPHLWLNRYHNEYNNKRRLKEDNQESVNIFNLRSSNLNELDGLSSDISSTRGLIPPWSPQARKEKN